MDPAVEAVDDLAVLQGEHPVIFDTSAARAPDRDSGDHRAVGLEDQSFRQTGWGGIGGIDDRARDTGPLNGERHCDRGIAADAAIGSRGKDDGHADAGNGVRFLQCRAQRAYAVAGRGFANAVGQDAARGRIGLAVDGEGQSVGRRNGAQREPRQEGCERGPWIPANSHGSPRLVQATSAPRGPAPYKATGAPRRPGIALFSGRAFDRAAETRFLP